MFDPVFPPHIASVPAIINSLNLLTILRFI